MIIIIIILIILFISLYYRRQCRDLNYISVSLNWNVTPGITTISHNPELHGAHIDKRIFRNAIFLLHSLMCFRPKCHGGESTAEIMAGHPGYKHLQRDGDLTSHVSRDVQTRDLSRRRTKNQLYALETNIFKYH